MEVSSIDIYVTYRCGLRCSHCFVGNNLDTNENMEYDTLQSILDACFQWKTREVVFLGGEPTLYPYLDKAIRLAQEKAFQVRIVTNGQSSFRKFIDRFGVSNLPHISVSIDGSSPEFHDLIRGAGSYSKLMTNIRRSIQMGYKLSGIISVSNQNKSDLLRLLQLCDTLRFEYVNIHYVTNRGFAKDDYVIPIDEWNKLYKDVVNFSASLDLGIKMEETFINAKQHKITCAVRNRSSLMFFPDRRVFMCSMFIDVPNSHSYIWSDNKLVSNPSLSSEQVICDSDFTQHCPAMHLVNKKMLQQTRDTPFSIGCIFVKQHIKRGQLFNAYNE